jgi:hypothetical protein
MNFCPVLRTDLCANLVFPHDPLQGPARLLRSRRNSQRLITSNVAKHLQLRRVQPPLQRGSISVECDRCAGGSSNARIRRTGHAGLCLYVVAERKHASQPR